MAHSVPRTLDELVTQYDRYITGCIFKVSKGHVRPDDVEDLRQKILLRVHERKYLQRFDPAKGSFNSYLYWLIRSVVVNQFDANTRDPLNTAIGVVQTQIGSPTKERTVHALVLDTYQDAVDDSFERAAMAREFANQFESHLRRTHRPWGPAITLPDGSSSRRSLALVFRLMRESLEPREIASVLKVAPSSAFGYLKRVRVEARKFAGPSAYAV